MNGTGGWSFIEVLIVVAIAGTLVALGDLPSRIAGNGARLQTAKTQLRDFLQQARNLARGRRQCVAVRVEPTQITATAYLRTPPCTPPLTTPDPAVRPISAVFAPGVVLTPFDTGNPLIFNASGGLDTHGPSSMSLQGFGRTVAVQVFPAIGQILVP